MNGSYLKLAELGNRHRRMGRDNHLATLRLGFLSQPPKKPTESMRLEPCLDFVYYENGPDLRHSHAVQASQSAHDHSADLFFVLHHAS